MGPRPEASAAHQAELRRVKEDLDAHVKALQGKLQAALFGHLPSLSAAPALPAVVVDATIYANLWASPTIVAPSHIGWNSEHASQHVWNSC